MRRLSPEGDRQPLRIVLAGVTAFDAVVLTVFALGAASETPHRGPPASALVRSLAFAPCLVSLTALTLLALAFFARGQRPIASGLVALAALSSIEHVQASLSAGHERTFFVGGAALAGWVLGLAFGDRMGNATNATSASISDARNALAQAGAIAGIACPYVLAGLSKLTTAGLVWADAAVLQTTILSTHPIDDTSLLASYARLVVDHAGLARALSVATLVIQLGAVTYVVGPRMRMLWGTLLLSFHVNVALLSQSIFYVQSCALLLAFSFPWRRVFGTEARPPAWPDVTQDATWAATLGVARWVAVAVAAAWVARSLGVVGP